MCCAVLSSSVKVVGVHLCFGLVEGWQEHLLMVQNLLVYTMVLLEDWDRHFSWKACSHKDFFVGEALHAWCQPWRCSRGTWRTSQSIRSPLETLGFCRRFAIGSKKEEWLPRLLAPFFASTASPWSICHWLCPCFFPLDRVIAVR